MKPTIQEKVAERLLKRDGRTVAKLDKTDHEIRCPDYLVTDVRQRSVLLEVKTIERDYIQTIILKKISDVLSDAEAQRRAYVGKFKHHAGLPFVVVLFMEGGSDTWFDAIPRDLVLIKDRHDEVSAIMTVERRRAIDEKIRTLAQIEHMLRLLDSGQKTGLPPETKTWKIIYNNRAIRPLWRDYFC